MNLSNGVPASDSIIITAKQTMGKSEKIEDIVEMYSPPLLNFIRSQVKRPEDAEDILQDLFYQLARFNDDADNQIESVSSWLYRVARNMVMNFWRKRRETSLADLFDAGDEICEDIAQSLACRADDGPEDIYFRKMIWEELDNALAELPAEQSEIFCLTVFDGLPIKDISQTTGVPAATLLSRKHYAVKHLRKKFHELYHALITKD